MMSEEIEKAIGRFLEALTAIDRALSEEDYEKAMKLYSTVPQWIEFLAGRKDLLSVMALTRATQVRETITHKYESHVLKGTMYSLLADAVSEMALFEHSIRLGKLASDEFRSALVFITSDEEKGTTSRWLQVLGEKTETWQREMLERDAEKFVRGRFANFGKEDSVAAVVGNLIRLRENLPERFKKTEFAKRYSQELEQKLSEGIDDFISKASGGELNEKAIAEVIVAADRVYATLDSIAQSGIGGDIIRRVRHTIEERVNDIVFKAVFCGKIYPHFEAILHSVFKKEASEGISLKVGAQHPIAVLGRELEARARSHMKVGKTYCREISIVNVPSFTDAFALGKALWYKGLPVRRIEESKNGDGTYSILIGYYVGKESHFEMKSHHEVARKTVAEMNLPAVKLEAVYEDEAIEQFIRDIKDQLVEKYQDGRSIDEAIGLHARLLAEFPNREEELREAFTRATYQIYLMGKSALAKQVFILLSKRLNTDMEQPILWDEKFGVVIQRVAPILGKAQGIWSVNVAELSDREEALDVARKLLERGIPVRPFPSSLHKYWLSIGDFDSEKERDACLSYLRSISSEIPISSGHWLFPKSS